MPISPTLSRPTLARPTVARRSRTAALLVAAALVSAACGGAEDSGLPEADIAVLGTDMLLWEPDRITVDAGTLSVAVVCGRGVNHNFVIEETGEEVASCAPGQTAFGEVTLDAGEYTYVCTVPGHEVTMRGALEVR
jgi:plastocyanin